MLQTPLGKFQNLLALVAYSGVLAMLGTAKDPDHSCNGSGFASTAGLLFEPRRPLETGCHWLAQNHQP